MITSLKDLPASLTKIMKAGLCPMIHGSPGSSKSAQVRQVAEKFNLKLIDIRLAQLDPIDLSGIPVKGDDGKMEFLPPKMFPLEGDPIPEGYVGTLLFFDELTSASKSIQAASYKIILDRMVGQSKIHKNVWMCAAGNKLTDNAVVNKMSTALQSRMVHIDVEMDSKAWLNWAHENEIDHRVVDFITFRPDLLTSFNPKHTDYTFANSRTWEFASKLIKDVKELNEVDLGVLSGTVGEGCGREFYAFTKIYSKLPTFDEMVANPTGIALPTEPAEQFAIIGVLANNATKAKINEVVTILERLPVEFAISALIPMLKKNPGFNNISSVVKYKQENIHHLM